MEIFRVNYIQFYEVKASSFAIDYTVEIHAKRWRIEVFYNIRKYLDPEYMNQS